jgi:hypothetical protein
MIRSKGLTEDGQLGTIFIHANIGSTHSAIAIERRAAVKNTMIINY